MRSDAVWSQEFRSYVSPSFLPTNERNQNVDSLKIKIDITKCIIKVSVFGFYELWMDDKKIRSINFTEYLLYRNYVKRIDREVSICSSMHT